MDAEAINKLSAYKTGHKRKRRAFYIALAIKILLVTVLVYFLFAAFGVFEKLRKISFEEKTLSSGRWEAYARLKFIADNLQQKKIKITVYDNKISRLALYKEYTESEKQLWVEIRRQLRMEFNKALEKSQYNQFMLKNGFPFTRKEDLPDGLTPLPGAFDPYFSLDGDVPADSHLGN